MKCENCGEDKHIVDITNYNFEVKEVISVNACCKACAEDKMRKDGYDDFEEYPY